MLEVLSDGTIKLTRGDTAEFTVPITYKKDHPDHPGEPYAVQPGDKLVFAVKTDAYDDKHCIRKEFTGNNEFKLDPKDTKELDFGTYKYDVELTTAEGDVHTVINNVDFVILEEVA